MYENLMVLSIFIFLYSISSKWLESTPISEAVLFTAFWLALATWVVFGAAVVGQAAPYFSWGILLYSLLSLTAARMLPVFLALAGMNLRTDEELFMGWFGPRGLASIVLG